MVANKQSLYFGEDFLFYFTNYMVSNKLTLFLF